MTSVEPRRKEKVQMDRDAERSTEPPRTIHHTESGGHSVDPKEILQSRRARKLISEVATRLKVSGKGESRR